MQTNRVAIIHPTTTPPQPLKSAPFPIQFPVVSHPAPDRRPSPFLLAMDCLKSVQLSPAAFALGRFLAHHARYAEADDRRRRVEPGEVFVYWPQAKLAAKRKKSLRQINRLVRALVKAGLEVRQRPRRGASYVFIPDRSEAESFKPKKEPQSVTGTGTYSSPGAPSFRPGPAPSNPHKSLHKNAADGVPSVVPSVVPCVVPSVVPEVEKKVLNKREKGEVRMGEGETQAQTLKAISTLLKQNVNPQVKVENPIPPDEGKGKTEPNPEAIRQAGVVKARNEATRARLGIAGETKGRHKLNVDTQAVVV